MLELRLTRRTYADLENIYIYGVKQFGVQQADAYYSALMQQIDALEQNPLLHPKYEGDESYRKCVFKSNTIYFQIYDNVLEIVRILGRQDIEREL